MTSNSIKVSAKRLGGMRKKIDVRISIAIQECIARDTDLQARLSEQIFFQHNTMWKGLVFTPHQMVLGLSSGIYDVPEGKNDTNFARSLNRIKEGINENQVASTRPHLTLGGSFPYEPGDIVHFLGSEGRIGLGCIAEVWWFQL